ncbi:hypothetical protein [Oceanobacter sp. 3_MG-2023]|uniref:rolling circle replication-associated protein n=1 Tax=Oceanobacter sp. 3_MG-2023 TaxID=3062622 RepID=UPI0027344ED0|nr:hypothetical protein [Oceanobacter sp. 3_MG-2023]MDP2505635.1 hypothetical protein [Oceanobacter sp. 3_MG-2023]
MTDSHLYSCLLSNRPSGGFFASHDADGLRVGSVSNDSKAAERSDRAYRLVKAAKSPTGLSRPSAWAVSMPVQAPESEDDPSVYFPDGRIDLDTGEVIRYRAKDHNTKVIFERKTWADEYRVRTRCDTATGKPPEQAGKRISQMLTLAGASKLAESCRYVHKKSGGYTTFLTLTLDEEARERVANGATIQSQVSRFWDAVTKAYKRGWTETLEGKEHKGQPHGDDDLDYCWVIENPKNEDGEDNPHVHIMMRWRVPYRDFQAWARRLERLWGQGFAHLEKIKEPEKAGAYMAKAAGYMTKGSKEDQGEVKGNRYGISRGARAPGWEVVGTYAAGLMGSLITEVHDFFLFEYGPKLRKRERLKELLEETPVIDKKRRQKIGKALEKVRAELNDEKRLPVRPSKHQLVMCGVNSFRAFMNWAKDKASNSRFAHWLPVKERGVYWEENQESAGAYAREYRRRVWLGRMNRAKGCCDEYWQAIQRGGVPEWVNDENIEWCM